MKYEHKDHHADKPQSPPSRGAWIEISNFLNGDSSGMSPPSRGAWIEIVTAATGTAPGTVAPLAGGVD